MPEEDYLESAEAAIEAVEEEEEEAQEQGVGPTPWVHWASLSTMVMALFSAAGGLLAGVTANEALIERQEELHQLMEVNRDVLETELLRTHLTIFESMGRLPPPPMIERLQSLERTSNQDSEKVLIELESSEATLEAHEIFAVATTLLSVAISLTGMSVIARRRGIWLSSLVIASAGALLLVYGLSELA